MSDNKQTLHAESFAGYSLGDVITITNSPTRWQRVKRWVLRLFGLYAEPKPKEFIVTSIGSNTIEIAGEE